MQKENKKCEKNFLLENDTVVYKGKLQVGMSEDIVRKISLEHDEPEWMLNLRLQALKIYFSKQMPKWGPNLENLSEQEIIYFAQVSGSGENKSWEEVPENIKNTFEKLGIPEAEKKALAGVGAQYDSESVYHNIKDSLKEQGVLFEDLGTALKKYPNIVKKYFSSCISLGYHKFSALHYAVWSGGTFLYIPSGVKIKEPLQSYFRMNVQSGGQFEHTLIILEEGAEAHYIEGCSAPKYGTNSLHAGGVEIFVGKNARFRYSSVENWSLDTYNLNTKKAIIEENASIEWVGGNLGSQVTMLYPCSVLKGDNASAEHLGIALASGGQNQDTGAKIIHIGKNTKSKIMSKSISKDGGKNTYRGLVHILPQATGSISRIDCDGLILDDISSSDSIPNIIVENTSTTLAHEASAGKINEEYLFYLQSRGMDEEQAKTMIVNGFISPIVKELPLEYASELNVLIGMEMKENRE
ncbi:Fe-S cluster assembly protein SufB [Candidatus Gracilibacteria bacterium]|nr:Fe-S cluster assembly protein SufB [Candidatus Gracilibacteria bacterium]NUJ98801.1 Fe-S cluster assembly protein SufB [Candidatus Gracilibacteria bacterium]